MCVQRYHWEHGISMLGFVGGFVGIVLGSGRGTVGKCAGPKRSKMVQTTILVKMTLFRAGF